MRRTDLVIAALVLGLGGFVAYQALRVERSPAPQAAPADGAVTSAPASDVVVASTSAAPVRDIAAIRKYLTEHASGTFIGDVLAARDSNIARWPERTASPVRVWIDERSALAMADQMRAANVRRAFGDWAPARVPITFAFVQDSAGADVRVTFVEQFEGGASGRTLWKRDTNWWIQGGEIILSLRNTSGGYLNNDQLYAIALHEVGHLLGLDHSSRPGAIMAAHVSVLALTPEDIATMRLIYEVQPGSVR
jgi:hypothetical protein